MRYKAMRLICMFDLPMETKNQQRAYRDFRKFLLKNGFEMLQYSVYIRTCPDRSFANKYYNRVETNSPNSGSILMFNITEKQYEDMKYISCKDKNFKHILGSESLVVI